MKKNVDLMALFWTTAGLFPGAAGISRFDFKDRVEAAARAGFKGIGIWHTDLEHILQTRSLKEMKQILDDNDIRHLELEFLTDWFVDDARKVESDRVKHLLLEASAALHAKHIKVGDFNNTPCPMPQIVESFASLCREAEAYGATIGYEFMASANIHTFEDALALVETAGAPNGGLVLDMVHVVNLGFTHQQIKRIPLRYLTNFELNDGALPGSPLYDPTRERRWCGEGDFDIQGLICCANEMGYAGPWAVEVFSQELAGLSVDELSAQAFQTTMAEFNG
jgi:sugar phosphate isomerase/epimerase